MSGRAPLPSLAISFDLSKSDCCARRSDHPACSAPNVRLRGQSTDRQLELAQKEAKGRSVENRHGGRLASWSKSESSKVRSGVGSSVSAKFKLDHQQYATSTLDALLSKQTVLSGPLARSSNDQAEGRHQLLLTSRLSAFSLTPRRRTSLRRPLLLASFDPSTPPIDAYFVPLQGTLMRGWSSLLGLS